MPMTTEETDFSPRARTLAILCGALLWAALFGFAGAMTQRASDWSGVRCHGHLRAIIGYGFTKKLIGRVVRLGERYGVARCGNRSRVRSPIAPVPRRVEVGAVIGRCRVCGAFWPGPAVPYMLVFGMTWGWVSAVTWAEKLGAVLGMLFGCGVRYGLRSYLDKS